MKQIAFETVDEFWDTIRGCELALVIYGDGASTTHPWVKALGELEDGEACFVVDASSIGDDAKAYYLTYSALDKRINPAWEGKIPLPFARAFIHGFGAIDTAYNESEIPSMLMRGRKEKGVMKAWREREKSN